MEIAKFENQVSCAERRDASCRANSRRVSERTQRRRVRLNRGRMPIWNYTRCAGITGSCRLGLRLRFCLTCLTGGKNVIREQDTWTREGGTRTRRNGVANAFLSSSPTKTPRRVKRKSDSIQEKITFNFTIRKIYIYIALIRGGNSLLVKQLYISAWFPALQIFLNLHKFLAKFCILK